MPGLQREVIQWIHGLDLTWQMLHPKWDLTNGYLVAEIFSWYYPQEIQMHMYNNGASLESKLQNWSLLKNFIKREKLEIADEYVEGTIHCKSRAAYMMLERMYEVLTNRKLRPPPIKNTEQPDDYSGAISFSDQTYQLGLPLHARSTASQAVKNNMTITEMKADPSLVLNQQKAQAIISNHIDNRRDERLEFPQRFDKKPTLGELAVRRPPQPQPTEEYSTGESGPTSAMSKPRSVKLVDSKSKASSRSGCRSPVRLASEESAAMFKEITVNQMEKLTV